VLRRHGKPSRIGRYESSRGGSQRDTIRPRRRRCGALKKLAKQAGEAAQLLKMLANEKRLLILCFLAVRGEMTVGELVGIVKLSQSALSQHLAKLRADGLVEFRRTSQTLHYRVADERALRLLQVLKEIYCGELK
jgi:DNA-binding transcriptional ArsR family regulator